MGFNVTSSSAVHADVTNVMPAIKAACPTHPGAVRNLSGGYWRPIRTIKGVATAQGSQVKITVKEQSCPLVMPPLLAHAGDCPQRIQQRDSQPNQPGWHPAP